MKTQYESKIFNGEIDANVIELPIEISKEMYSDIDLYYGKINELRQRIESMQNNLMEKITNLERLSMDWSTKEKQINDLLTREETSVNDKIFLRSDTDGFFGSYLEDFSSIASTEELEESNISIDETFHYLTLKHGVDLSRKISPVLYSLNINKGPISGPERINVIDGSSLGNLSSGGSPYGWIGSVLATQVNTQSIVLTVSMNSPIEVGFINLSMNLTSGGALLSVVSTDENNVNSIALESAEVTSDNIVIIGKVVKTIQLIITKTNYDEILASGEFRYLFSFKSLNLFKNIPGFERFGTYTSKDINIGTASKIAIEVCDFVEKGLTSIDYELEITNDKGTASYKVNPLNKPPANGSYVVELEKNKKINNIVNPSTIVDGTSLDFIYTSNVSSLFGFENDYKVLNQKIKTKSNNLDKVNLFINYKNSLTQYSDLLERKGSSYFTWVFVDNNDYRRIAVGNSGIRIVDYFSASLENTQNVTTDETMLILDKSGWYRIEIPIASYVNVGSEFSDMNELQELDPLYPYNGKYLIEGTNLNLSPYMGFPIRAQRKLLPTDDLNTLDLNNFLLVRSIETGDTIYLAMVSKNLDAKNGFVEYLRENNSSATTKVKATLRTNDSARTPIISSYKLKLGD
jgi:hypothetical protein